MQNVLIALGTGLLVLVVLALMDHFHFYPNSLLRDGLVAVICGLVAAVTVPRVLPKAKTS